MNIFLYVKIFINMDKVNIKKIVKESLLKEVGGADVLTLVEKRVGELFDDVLTRFKGDMSETMITTFLINAIKQVAITKGFDGGNNPSTYTTHNNGYK